MSAKALLQLRLAQLGYDGHLASADNCRTAILSLLCAEAVAGRLQPGGKCLTFRALYEEAFGQAWETRERKERAARKRA